jgi:hypothetical protein
MNEADTTEFFSKSGRRRLTRPYRIFDTQELTYYKIVNGDVDYDKAFLNYQAAGYVEGITKTSYVENCELLRQKISSDHRISNLLGGVHVPFVVPRISGAGDLSEILIERNLPYLERSFRSKYPEAHFKAIMQGGTSLYSNLSIATGSNYNTLIDAARTSTVFGWYFPQALQQFDVDSQVGQMSELHEIEGLCLSGPLETISALIGRPDLLISDQGYTPILMMSSVKHSDDRLALALKAYGPHLEFWCLSQMLTPKIKQVSEQWTNGVTIFQRNF